ncbi:hypothetical protein [Streptomyces sp. Ac-502]|uniref:hypothetical protein n=1 Tax=Streptomyces sp. Ac-502 TaxID=3342801 RepID=UPI003862A2D4
MSGRFEEPEQAPPWRPEEGPQPQVWCFPAGDRPALYVSLRRDGREEVRYAPVTARHDYPDGRVACHVEIKIDDGTVHRAYWWPQPSLRVAHRSASAPADREPIPRAGRPGGRIDAADA